MTRHADWLDHARKIRSAARAILEMRGEMREVDEVATRVQACESGALSVLYRAPFQGLTVLPPDGPGAWARSSGPGSPYRAFCLDFSVSSRYAQCARNRELVSTRHPRNEQREPVMGSMALPTVRHPARNPCSGYRN